MNYISSWSGGKDSCLACYRAMKSGMKISSLVYFEREFNLHGVDPELIRLQAELAGIPIVQRKIVSEDFESEFKETVKGLLGNGVRGMVFGDIYLEPHREWVERVCGGLGIEAHEPLWGMNTEKLMEDFIAEGFKTIIVSGNEKFIDKKWIGSFVESDFIEYLKGRELDPCGENGEYHSFVVSGPMFKGKIEIQEKDVTRRDGFWFLNIKGYRIKTS
ncbi:MAG: diphthine--ammonia ligase [Nitrospirae bacterium]|nr:diphthine--ammonia ligase [Nitrospirota bacterium]